MNVLKHKMKGLVSIHHAHTHTHSCVVVCVPVLRLAPLLQVSSSVSAGSIDKSRLDELGSQLAQFRERLTDMDRSVTAIGNAGM